MTTSAVKREMRDRVYAAFVEGCYARLIGDKLPACPYTARTGAADSWELGWERTDDTPIDELVRGLEEEIERLKQQLAEVAPKSEGAEALTKIFNEIIAERKAAGRAMTMGKHTAANYATRRRIIAELDAAGMHEAACWGVWLMWWDLSHHEWGELIIEDFQDQIKQLRQQLAETESTVERHGSATVYCHACSVAAGADFPVYHEPPVCSLKHLLDPARVKKLADATNTETTK